MGALATLDPVGDSYHFLTAGHTVYRAIDGGWATDVRVEMGADGMRRPYGTAGWTNIRTYTSWTQDENPGDDWALITLDRNVGAYSGAFGYGVYNGGDLNTAGYPGDLDGGTRQYRAYGPIDSYDGDILKYRMDTWPGQSGSPMWLFDGTNSYIEGIVTAQDSSTNYGVRVNTEKFSRIQSWIGQDARPVDRPDLTDYDSWFGTSTAYRSSAAVRPGEPFTARAVVQNNGTAATGYTIYYYASRSYTNLTDWTSGMDGTHPAAGSDDYLIGAQRVSSVSPYSWSDAPWTGPLPNIPAGNYYLSWRIVADTGEYDATNNTGVLTSSPFTVLPRQTAFALDSGGYLWEHDLGFDPGLPAEETNAHWRLLSSAPFDSISSATNNGQPVVFGILKGSHLLVEHDPAAFEPATDPGAKDAHWRLLSSVPFDSISATTEYGRPVVFGIRADGFLFEHDPTLFDPAVDPGAEDAHWRLLSTAPFAAVAATASIGPAAVFGVMAGNRLLWEHDLGFDPASDPGATDAHWRLLSSAPFTSISATHDPATGSPVVYGVRVDGFLFEHSLRFDAWADPGSIDAHWRLLSSAPFSSISATYDPTSGFAVVFAIRSDGLLFEQDPGFDPATDPGVTDAHWRLLSTARFTAIGAGESDGPAVWGYIPGAGLWYHNLAFDPTTDPGQTNAHWRLLSTGTFTGVSAPA